MLEVIESKLVSIIKQNVSFINDIDPANKLQDLGINSITFIKIVVAIEAEFGFEFNDDELNYDKFNSLSDVVKYIDERTH
ncbi:MAG: acyl carrier protein [Clostridia bacterium]|nr:acyl carrier protein [Clostridia bacterium]